MLPHRHRRGGDAVDVGNHGVGHPHGHEAAEAHVLVAQRGMVLAQLQGEAWQHKVGVLLYQPPGFLVEVDVPVARALGVDDGQQDGIEVFVIAFLQVFVDNIDVNNLRVAIILRQNYNNSVKTSSFFTSIIIKIPLFMVCSQ